MADKQWFLTKVITTALCLMTVISICIGGSNVLFELKRDVIRVEDDMSIHQVKDEKQWDKAWVEIDKTKEKQQLLELQNIRMETNQKEILRRLDELHNMIASFEMIQ